MLAIGKSARQHCIVETLDNSKYEKEILSLADVDNIGLRAHSKEFECGKTDDPAFVAKYAELWRPDFAVIGPEEPLAAGVVDTLAKLGIPSVGPSEKLARLETSKSFARQILERHGIPGNPLFRRFETRDGLREYMKELGQFVVKPDGLTGGKGVKVWGDHFSTLQDGYDYASELLSKKRAAVVVEEKLEGEEFSFQSFSDGTNVVHMIPVQDHKRLLDADEGPNTGGMGSYTCEDHCLPFLTSDDLRDAGRINHDVVQALRSELGSEYKGIVYGGFIATRSGIRLIEFNARFGDPEAMNVLPLLETDFIDVCEAIISGTLNELDIRFSHKATVCKYVVPEGYPDHGVDDVEISLPVGPAAPNLRTYYGAVKGGGSRGPLKLTGSRAVAFVGIGSNVDEAERIAESAASKVVGPVQHRKDIGTKALIQKRVGHMSRLRAPQRPLEEVQENSSHRKFA
ncbi:MAG: phosphoribosylamine--glycine ligase [Alphaproteobacteria bacterium]|nr:phosphoribosylamine--glycine ligase [Alphaproteobacteria bacterium]